jgi:hypothetical protein
VGFFNGMLLNPGDFRLKQDSFQTENRFGGAQIGCICTCWAGQLQIDMRPSIAFGTTSETVAIAGSTLLVPASGVPPTTLPGGLLALPSNSGRFTTNKFAVVPEFNLTVGWWLTSWARMSVGYQFLYWSSVMRPGNQIDQAINTTELPISPDFNPAARNGPPTVPLRASDFWAQGLTLGFMVSF